MPPHASTPSLSTNTHTNISTGARDSGHHRPPLPCDVRAKMHNFCDCRVDVAWAVQLRNASRYRKSQILNLAWLVITHTVTRLIVSVNYFNIDGTRTIRLDWVTGKQIRKRYSNEGELSTWITGRGHVTSAWGQLKPTRMSLSYTFVISCHSPSFMMRRIAFHISLMSMWRVLTESRWHFYCYAFFFK